MRSLCASLVAAAALAVASPVAAQTIAHSTSTSGPGFRAFGIVELDNMLATQSFKAVLTSGRSSVPFFGGGVDVTDLWKGVFVRADVEYSTNKGSRVFVDDQKVAHTLPVPLTIAMTPIEIGAGWRFGAHRSHAVRPYIGAAIVMQRYQETSDDASADENSDETDRGEAVFGGVEFGLGMAKVGVEGNYRNIPNVIGAGGVSQAYGENNLGGAGLRVTIGVGF